jgi:putative endonuclease
VRRARGRVAEDAALAFLLSHGLALVARNYRCRLGELDLVMRDGATLVFVEVRARTHTAWGTPEASVDRRKQARLCAAAGAYLASHPAEAARPMRFDVVVFSGPGGDNKPRWLRAAFDAA